MTEKPILMAGPMVRAILSGAKTQTRRIAKYDPMLGYPADWCPRVGQPDFDSIVGDYRRFCPYGQPGDHLWVRETWAPVDFMVDVEREDPVCVGYRADLAAVCHEADNVHAIDTYGWNWSKVPRWRPSIHMPRWASRLTLEIVGVRVERLQAISEADALAEGIRSSMIAGEPVYHADEWPTPVCGDSPVSAFAALWDSLAKPGAQWFDNPFVWVLEWAPLAKGATP